MENYFADMHTHTIASGHAYSTIKEMAEAAQEKGIKLLGITEHSKNMPGSCQDIYFANLRVVDRKIGDVELALGVELNIMDYDGTVDMDEELIAKQDIVIASMHTPCIQPGTKEQNTHAYIKCCENPLIRIIGHPDDSYYPVDYDVLTDAAKRTSTLLEVNNNSLAGNFRQNTWENTMEMLFLCKEKKVPVLIGSDAHFYTRVGAHSYAEKLMKDIDFPMELVMNLYPERLKEYINVKSS
ncbi:MAG: phosphatase [Lachnospiraceae bacterium]|jgi:Histidinol phosphatase and related hydrolases of the PHP family|nr:phosphatase [Lachnospiraceae bacterium]MCI8825440.1 phosphatase [Lachnospiraceae bacterium]MCI9369089.1 phosphatase [Lachnospiraceae bacterium]